jgi:O-antigen ligase
VRRSDWIAVSSTAAAVAASVLIVGGALRWGQAVVGLLVAGGIAAIVGSRRVAERMSSLSVLLVAAIALTALQLIPLPAAVIEALNPTGAGLRADGAALLHTSPSQTITMDYPASLRALAFFVILLGIAALSLRTAATERGKFRVLAIVASVCGATATVVGVHQVLGAHELYGIYAPVDSTPTVMGPLLNTNHLGGLLAMGCAVSAGLVFYRNQRGWLRTIWVVTTGACGIAALATLSRGAVVALAAGLLLCGGLLVAQRYARNSDERRRRRFGHAASIPTAVIAACALLLIVYVSGGGVEGELSKTSFDELTSPKSKYAAWQASTNLVAETPWVGVGRGGFEGAFTRVHPMTAFVSVSHVENEYLQTVVDWGIVGAAVFGTCACWFLWEALRRWREGPLTAAALAGTAVVALQSVVDFGVELLGVAAPLTAVAATLAVVPLREASGNALARARAARVVLIAALVAASLIVTCDMTTSLAEDHERLRTRKGLTLDLVRESAERHPLDYYVYGVAAELMQHRGDPNAVRLLNHAMTLHPTHPGLHRMAARLLAKGGHAPQAAIEYAQALRGSRDPTVLVREIVDAFATPEMAAMALPTDFPAVDRMVRVLNDLDRTSVATAWLQRVQRERPRDVQICEALYSLSVKKGDLRAAELAARTCLEVVPSQKMRLALARVLSAEKSYDPVVQLLTGIETWRGRIDDLGTGWLMLCDAYAGLTRWDETLACLRRLETTGYLANRPREVMRRIEAAKQGSFGSAPALP